MLTQDVIKLLVRSELKPLDISDVGEINGKDLVQTPEQEANMFSLIQMINAGNQVLHEKFALIQKEIVIKNIRHNHSYGLPKDFIHPLHAMLENGAEIPLNHEGDTSVECIETVYRPAPASELRTIECGAGGISILFPAPYTALIRGNDANGTFPLSLLYIAAPRTVIDPEDDVRLPPNFIQPLLDYVSYKAYIGVDGHIEGVNNTYYRRFLAGCAALKETGLHLSTDNLGSNTKLEERGFV